MSAKHRESPHRHQPGTQCATCGNPNTSHLDVEVDDRYFQLLLAGIALGMKLEVSRKGRTAMEVAGPDRTTIERCSARLTELAPRLEAELIAVTEAFVERETGVVIKTRR